MTNLAVRQTIIIPVGAIGYEMAIAYKNAVESRHPNIVLPTTQTIALLDEKMSGSNRLAFPSVFLEVKKNSSLSELAYQLYGRDQYIKWKDDPIELNDQLLGYDRLRGQIALRQALDEFQLCLDEAKTELYSQTTKNYLNEQKITLLAPNQLDVFILLSLADIYMTGVMPDLPYIVQKILSAGRPSDQPVHIHLLLALPNFKGEVTFEANDAKTVNATKFNINALSAACLREIDYYLAGQEQYYQQKYSDIFIIESNQNPLREGRIFLIENGNENGGKLDDVNALCTMVGNWLYHVTMTPLHQFLSSPEQITEKRYSSFGLSSLWVPLNKWKNRASIDLQSRLLNKLTTNTTQEDYQPDLGTIRHQLKLSEGAIRETLLEGTIYNSIEISASKFRTISLSEPEQVLNGVQKNYNKQMERVIELHQELKQRKEELDNKHPSFFVQPLKKYLLELLDDKSGNGIIKTHQFLVAFRDALEQEKQKLELENNTRKKTALEGNHIVSKRNNYLVKSIMMKNQFNLPLVGIVLPFLLLLVPVVLYLVRLFQRGSNPWILAGVVGILLAITIYVFGRMVTNINLAKLEVVRAYNARVREHREINLLNVLLEVYEDLIAWVDGARNELNLTWRNLNTVREKVKESWESVKVTDTLCNNDGISISLLTPDLITYFEKETSLSNLDETLESFQKIAGKPSKWVLEQHITDTSLLENLQSVTQNRASTELARYDFATVWQTIKEEQQRIKFQQAEQLSFPYWQYDPTQMGSHSKPLQLVAKSGNLAIELPNSFKQVESLDRYEVVLTTVRHGFLLKEMRSYKELLNDSYLVKRGKNQEKHSLHTLVERLAFPDPTRAGRSVGSFEQCHPLHIYAIARGLDIIKIGEFPPGPETTPLTTSYQIDGRNRKIANTPVETVIVLETHTDIYRDILEQIGNEWGSEGTPMQLSRWTKESAETEQDKAEIWAKECLKPWV